MDAATPTERLAAIVEQGLCVGCGICESISPNRAVTVTKTRSGYEHPVVIGRLDHATVDRIYDVCPGTRIDGQPVGAEAPSTFVDPVWGPLVRLVRSWAGDDTVRYRGSTGGVLTALAQHLLATSRVDFILHVKASTVDPTFGEPTLSFTESEVLEASGSRYGPTAALRSIVDVLDRGRPFAFVAKPCDVAALRNYARHDPRVDELARYWLTPVCGGFGPPAFTDRFVANLGLDRDEVTAMRYRGYGCPGPTRVETANSTVEVDYLDYWGEDETQWSLPWRCKLCPDGIGEAADIAAADTWPGGSPSRDASATDPGTNAVLIRTEAGRELFDSAVTAGAIVVERDISVEEMNHYQPHQVRKKQTVGARFEALGEAGRIVPSTSGLRIDELRDRLPSDQRSRQRQGTHARIAAGKASFSPAERQPATRPRTEPG